MRSTISRRAERIAVATLFALLFVAVGALLGQDLNFDQMNYHLSAPRELLGGEDWSRYAIAQRQSWLNPLPQVPGYLIVTGLPAPLAMVALALLPVANALAVHAIARRFVFPGLDRWSALAALACAFVGATGTIHLLVVATTFAEAWLSAVVLGGCYAILAAAAAGDAGAEARWLAIAGLCLGVAAGLKPTNLPYCLAGLVAALATGASWRGLAWFAAAGALAAMLGGGWWHWLLWRDYANPVFPMANGLFGSPWIGGDALPPEPFAARRWWNLFADPLALAIGDHSRPLSTLLPNRDARHALGLYAGLALLLAARRRDGARPLLALATFWVAGFAAWFALFGIDRYAIPLELLAPTVAAALARQLGWLDRRGGRIALLVVLALVVAASRPVRSWRAPASGDWFELAVPPALDRPGTLYVMTGGAPLAWLTLFPERFGAGAAFVRVGGNMRYDPDTLLGRHIAARIAGHRGAMRALFEAGEIRAARAQLARFGLRPSGPCAAIRSKAPTVLACPLQPLRHHPAVQNNQRLTGFRG